MELKDFQQEVLNDLNEFIEIMEETEQINVAFSKFWANKGIAINSIEDNYLKPYDNSIKMVPRVTMKVPTSGGKTFIACNALKPIFDSFPLDKPKVVAWFVPSDTILKQTYKNLSNSAHPYRQKIDSHFNGAVEVYRKEDLLQGQRFSPTEIKEQLSIFVLSVQSFSANNKEARKAYQENENLAEFPATFNYKDKLLPNVDETALMQVITQLNPVVIIDESHNFEADLRIEMLNNLNPSFVLDLTATPREKSNIISFVDAMKLKKSNMVKLPVIVYNHQDTDEVISSAIQLQKTLEEKARIMESNGGKHIRPIVLFQAQPKTSDDNVTFEKIKLNLLSVGIPEEQIKIKTANKDEIKHTNLMSKDCEVRFIITVNALKEGWDCPFAYILASLANKSSSVDVEQILGRILRLPYVSKHFEELLNFSYVFTASNNFFKTLDKIILGLNRSGFSEKDYRIKQDQKAKESDSSFEELFKQQQLELEDTEETVKINSEKIKDISSSKEIKKTQEDIIALAKQTNQEYEEKFKELEKEDNLIPPELGDKVKQYAIKEIFKKSAKSIKIPTFFKKVNTGSLFEPEGALVPLTKGLLLEEFDLSVQDHNINFTRTSSEMVSIDLAEQRKNEYIPQYRKVNNQAKEAFVKYISSLSPEARVNTLADRLSRQIRRIDEIPEPKIIEFIRDSIKNLDSDKIAEISHNEFHYARTIKNKIDELIEKHSEKQFEKFLDTGQVVCQKSFEFQEKIHPKNTIKSITKNLYTEEGEMNDFEKKVIHEIANLENVEFWHRNLERGKGLLINGFINHYPDFIVKMKNGKIVIVETKGDHLDGSDSHKKIKLGEKWASKAGEQYRYFMVFETKKVDGAKTLPELLNILNMLN